MSAPVVSSQPPAKTRQDEILAEFKLIRGEQKAAREERKKLRAQTDRKRRAKWRRSCCWWIVLFAVLFAALYFFMVHSRRASRDCFAVDILRSRVPHRTPAPYVSGSKEPFGIGTVCFDVQQRLVEWRIEENFITAYGVDYLADLRLHGPLDDHTPKPLAPGVEGPAKQTVAPVVMPMGLQRNARQEFVGASIIEPRDLFTLQHNATRYYVALYILNQNSNAQIEVARSPLIRPKP